VRQIYPPGRGGEPPDLAALYAYPAGLDRAWVRANMIESADGAAAVDGLSGGLSGPGDRAVFGVLRALADVILVGAGTAREEKYQPARVRPEWAGLRAGRPAAPPIAVLSGGLGLDLAGPLLSSTAGGPAPDARTIVLTSAAADPDLSTAVAAHADVIVAGERQVDLAAAVTALAGRGHRRILAEGGPHLLGQLVAAGLLDELCVTVSPVLAGGQAGRIIQGPPGSGAPARLDLAHILTDEDYLFCRYLIQRSAG
jgi:riboflavin biosynthesis pyrimidine reductase